jgi:hypothetical protein
MPISVGHSSETSYLQLFPAAAFGNLPERHPALGDSVGPSLNVGGDCLSELNTNYLINHCKFSIEQTSY